MQPQYKAAIIFNTDIGESCRIKLLILFLDKPHIAQAKTYRNLEKILAHGIVLVPPGAIFKGGLNHRCLVGIEIPPHGKCSAHADSVSWKVTFNGYNIRTEIKSCAISYF